jgi:hypothetical protein
LDLALSFFLRADRSELTAGHLLPPRVRVAVEDGVSTTLTLKLRVRG